MRRSRPGLLGRAHSGQRSGMCWENAATRESFSSIRARTPSPPPSSSATTAAWWSSARGRPGITLRWTCAISGCARNACKARISPTTRSARRTTRWLRAARSIPACHKRSPSPRLVARISSCGRTGIRWATCRSWSARATRSSATELRVRGEVDERRLDATVNVRLLGELQLREYGVDVLLDRALGQEERCGDACIVPSHRHLLEHIALARRQLSDRRVTHRAARRDEHLDHTRVDHRPTPRDLAHRADELVYVGDTLFQQVRTTACALLEQRQCVLWLRVLAQDHNAHLGTLGTQALGGPKALVGPGRWHPDIGDHDRRAVLLDSSLQPGEVDATLDQLDLVRGLEQLPDALSQQVIVLGEDDADRHAMRIGVNRCRVPASPRK